MKDRKWTKADILLAREKQLRHLAWFLVMSTMITAAVIYSANVFDLLPTSWKEFWSEVPY
jgi:hypothetical protein